MNAMRRPDPLVTDPARPSPAAAAPLGRATEKPPLVRAAAKTVALQRRLREHGPAITQGLGWMSLAFGVAGLVAPRAVARFVGVRPQPLWIRLYGLRDLALGAGLIGASDKRPWLKARAACDALDAVTIARHADTAGGRHATALLATAGAAALAFVEASLAARLDIEAMHRAASRFDYSDRVGLREAPATLLGRRPVRPFETPADMRHEIGRPAPAGDALAAP